MQFTIIGAWRDDQPPSFAVVAEGDSYPEAEVNAAHQILANIPSRSNQPDSETADTLWWGERGAYVLAVFHGDVTSHLIPDRLLKVIA